MSFVSHLHPNYRHLYQDAAARDIFPSIYISESTRQAIQRTTISKVTHRLLAAFPTYIIVESSHYGTNMKLGCRARIFPVSTNPARGIHLDSERGASLLHEFLDEGGHIATIP